MTTYLVSRHPGAVQWIRSRGVEVDAVVSHLDPAQIVPGDRVVGNLPVHLAAVLCERGACYIHLSLEVPPALRGMELDTALMEAAGARLEFFEVRRLLDP